jgi:hypothetical protein
MTPNYTTDTQDATASRPLRFESSPPRAEDFPAPSSAFPSKANPHQIAVGGLAQTFGLLPGMAALTVGVDLMLHGADVMSAGLLIPFSAAAGVVLGYITYCAQRKHYGDDEEAAKIKGLVVAVLTIIPSPLPYMLFIPAGLAGWLHDRRRQ